MEGRVAGDWRLKGPRLRFEGEKCPNPECEQIIFPPRIICPECGRDLRTRECGAVDPPTGPTTITQETLARLQAVKTSEPFVYFRRNPAYAGVVECQN